MLNSICFYTPFQSNGHSIIRFLQMLRIHVKLFSCEITHTGRTSLYSIIAIIIMKNLVHSMTTCQVFNISFSATYQTLRVLEICLTNGSTQMIKNVLRPRSSIKTYKWSATQNATSETIKIIKN